VETLSPKLAVEAMATLLTSMLLPQEVSQVCVAKINWPLFKQLYTLKQQRFLFEQIPVLTEQATTLVATRLIQTNENINHALLRQLASATAIERESILIQYLQEQVTGILKMHYAEWPSLGQGFFEAGMDSLMAIELKNKIMVNLNVTLPATLIFDYANLKALVTYLGYSILGWSEDNAKPEFDSLSAEVVNTKSVAVEQGVDPILERLMRLERLISD